jgi:hypothetical protein
VCPDGPALAKILVTPAGLRDKARSGAQRPRRLSGGVRSGFIYVFYEPRNDHPLCSGGCGKELIPQ